MKPFLLFLLLVPYLLPAQVTDQQSVSLSVNPFYQENIEGIISGNKHAALGIALEGAWQKGGPNSTQSFGLELGFAKPKTALEPAAYSTWLGLKFQYEYLRELKQVNTFRLLAGGMAQASYRIGYYPNWDDSHAYWTSFIGGGVSAKAEQPMGNQKSLFAAFDLPLTGALSRPPASRTYKIENSSASNLIAISHRQLQLATLNHYFNPRLALGIHLGGSPSFSTRFYYCFQYVRVTTSYSPAYRQLTQGGGMSFIF
jgi:hypothetical protein